jgi:hypothetical protein
VFFRKDISVLLKNLMVLRNSRSKLRNSFLIAKNLRDIISSNLQASTPFYDVSGPNWQLFRQLAILQNSVVQLFNENFPPQDEE